MKKRPREINIFDISQIEHKGDSADKVKTTDINILLNRVKLTKKNEFKKRIFFLFALMLAIS